MRAILLAVLALPAGFTAVAPVFGDEPPQAAERTTAHEPVAADKDEIQLPAGFKPKKRGKFVVYCIKESVMGTRFPAEKCYDENGIRAYILDRQENLRQVDKMRRICGSMEACGGGG